MRSRLRHLFRHRWALVDTDLRSGERFVRLTYRSKKGAEFTKRAVERWSKWKDFRLTVERLP